MTLTRQNLHAAMNCGSPNTQQCAILGISYPLPNGWLRKLIGKEMPDADYERLVTLKRPKPNRPVENDPRRQEHEAKAIQEFKTLLLRHGPEQVEKIATTLSYARQNGLTINMTLAAL